MTDQIVPKGQLFTDVYVERGTPTIDSTRMRARLAAHVAEMGHELDLAKAVELRLGIMPKFTGGYRDWRDFFAKISIGEFLNCISIVHQRLQLGDQISHYGARKTNKAGAFLQTVASILSQENVSYFVDELGGVHLKVDVAFQNAKVAVVAALSPLRYANVLEQLENGLDQLNEVPLDGKGSIRSVFAAVESMFRLMASDAPRLARDQVQKHLPLVLDQVYQDRPSRRAATELGNSFAAWIDAAHWYRHEQGVEEPHQPPTQLAVAIVGQGIGWLRWLAELDAVGPKK